LTADPRLAGPKHNKIHNAAPQPP